jgi:hypothetical protein
LDEFVELPDGRDLAVPADQSAGATGRADLDAAFPDEADPEPAGARSKAARLEERGILEALRGA